MNPPVQNPTRIFLPITQPLLNSCLNSHCLDEPLHPMTAFSFPACLAHCWEVVLLSNLPLAFSETKMGREAQAGKETTSSWEVGCRRCVSSESFTYSGHLHWLLGVPLQITTNLGSIVFMFMCARACTCMYTYMWCWWSVFDHPQSLSTLFTESGSLFKLRVHIFK